MRAVVNLCGVPGSGKSTWARSAARVGADRGAVALVLEADWVEAQLAAGAVTARNLLGRLAADADRFFFPRSGSEDGSRHRSLPRSRAGASPPAKRRAPRHAFDASRQRRARDELGALLGAALAALARPPCLIVVDNCLTADSRTKIRRIAHRAGATYLALCLDTPLATCVARDAARPQPVGESVIAADAAQFEKRGALALDHRRPLTDSALLALLARAVAPAAPPPAEPKGSATLAEEAMRKRVSRLFAAGRLAPADAMRVTALKRAFLARRRADFGRRSAEELAAEFELELCRAGR